MNKQKNKKDKSFEINNEQKFKLQEEKSKLLNETQKTEKDCIKLEEKLKEATVVVEAVNQKLKDVDGKTSAMKMKNEELEERSQELNDKVDSSTVEMEKEIELAQTAQSEEVEELSSELKTEYENRMKNALASLREVYEAELSREREDYRDKYEAKIRRLQGGLSAEKARHNTNTEQTEENTDKIKKLITKIDNLQDCLGTLSEKERDLLQQIDQCNADHDKKVGLDLKVSLF